MLVLRQGDVFLTASATWLGKAIRFCQRAPGEEPSVVNHVGLILNGDGLGGPASSIEALGRVRYGDFREFYSADPSVSVAIYRDVTLSPMEAAQIGLHASRYLGRRYGAPKLLLHLADWILSRILGREVWLFRRLAWVDRYPICSWLVARVFSATGRSFGVHPGMASPDDVWDWMQAHPEKWVCVHPLQPLNPPGQDARTTDAPENAGRKE